MSKEGNLITLLEKMSVGDQAAIVEIGQGLILLFLFPIAYLLRKTLFYKAYILKGGSVTISALASFWLIQRMM